MIKIGIRVGIGVFIILNILTKLWLFDTNQPNWTVKTLLVSIVVLVWKGVSE